MDLKVHLFPCGDDSLELISSVIPESAREIVSARWSVALDDAVLQEILQGGESTDGFWISAEAVLSATELRELSHFEVMCRKFITESNKDYKRNFAACEGTPLVDKGGESPIRLATGFSLSRISMKPNMIGAIGDWVGEYVIGSAVADAFKSEEFTGLSLVPVNNPRIDAAHEDFFQIFSDCVLQPVEMDCSIERIQSSVAEENGKLRHLGCLSYGEEKLAEVPDFSRTAEPWAGWWGWPSWVVSANVVKNFRENMLRGWAFRPVLVKETELYSSYLGQWTQLEELVAQYSRSSFDGGR